ncbi:DUF3986 family protein [Brevibacillus sp. SYSU BS000544]|uniref:DUF3986 family protein n=1 Tax=Brevibacillus sp. SYSU BS000544 TaxID=3416443 RepID=UPI003CE4A2A6
MIITEEFLNIYSLRHCHPTYCRNGFDIEATAYQRNDTKCWDVFFDDFHNDLVDIPPFDNEDNKYLKLIFHYPFEIGNMNDLQQGFHLWVERVLLTQAKDQSVYLDQYT